MQVVGVDGCPVGWVAVSVDLPEDAALSPVGGGRTAMASGTWSVTVHATFAELRAAYLDAVAIGIDIPIGLATEGLRGCERIARGLLGARRSSVFTPPTRRLLDLIADVPTYQAANRLSHATLGHGLAVQAYNIYPRIREVDAVLTPADQAIVREVHPELSFRTMLGAPCAASKHTAEGGAERWAALRAHCPWLRESDLLRPPRGAESDDLLDALAAAWTAVRIATGQAFRIPAEPVIDARGLRMEMLM